MFLKKEASERRLMSERMSLVCGPHYSVLCMENSVTVVPKPEDSKEGVFTEVMTADSDHLKNCNHSSLLRFY